MPDSFRDEIKKTVILDGVTVEEYFAAAVALLPYWLLPDYDTEYTCACAIT